MLASILVLLGLVGGTRGNGYMLEPPSRSSMWRVGFNTSFNYNDNSLNCGGFGNEYYIQDGKCGICGDPFNQPEPRDNEAGGKYAKGIIVRNYQKGETIRVTIMVTANHPTNGYFEFRLCKNDNVNKVITQSCLDKHLLEVKDAAGTRYTLTYDVMGEKHLEVVLPSDVECSQCVLQWKWRGANNYGFDAAGHGCVGCGDQEEIYGCSDISIGSQGGHAQVPATPRPNTHAPPTHAPVVTTPRVFLTNAPPNQKPTYAPAITPVRSSGTLSPGTDYGAYSTCHSVRNYEGFGNLDHWCVDTCFRGKCEQAVCYCPDVNLGPGNSGHLLHLPSRPPVILGGGRWNKVATTVAPTRLTGHGNFDSCHGYGLWDLGMAELDNWCIENCAKGNCPSVQCYCPYLHGGKDVHGGTQTSQTTRPPKVEPTTKVPPVTHAPPVINTPSTKAPPVIFFNPTTGSPMIPVPTTKPPSVTLYPAQTGHVTPKISTGHGIFDSCHGVGLWGLGLPQLDNWCIENCAKGNCPSLQCDCPEISGHRPRPTGSHLPQTRAPTAAPILTPAVTPAPHPSVTPQLAPQITPSHALHTAVPPSFAHCRGVNLWKGVPQLDDWCKRSCAENYCPAEYCTCRP